jgi:hypothetical protein
MTLPARSRRPLLLGLLAAAALPVLVPGCAWFRPKGPTVKVKFVIVDNDNTFAAAVYAQEVSTGATTSFAYGPHTPYLTIDSLKPGTYVFYARLVEAPDDYHYGFTGYQPAAYGHMTRGGTRSTPVDLIALDLRNGGSYKVYISDHWARLPEPNKPVTVAWHREAQADAKP